MSIELYVECPSCENRIFDIKQSVTCGCCGHTFKPTLK